MMTKLMDDVTQDGGKLHRTTVATCATTYVFFIRDRLGERGLLLAHSGGPMGRTLSRCMQEETEVQNASVRACTIYQYTSRLRLAFMGATKSTVQASAHKGPQEHKSSILFLV